jgi:hypothetical protein
MAENLSWMTILGDIQDSEAATIGDLFTGSLETL